VTPVSRRAHLAALAGLLSATGMTVAFAASAAAQPIAPAQLAGGGKSPAARPGDNGTVKIHRSGTAVGDRRNQPHVCSFYLDAFGFDGAQSVSWQIKSWPPTGDRTVVASGALTLDSSGDGHTGGMTLSNGHYKLFWNFQGEHGFAKQKVFWVSCAGPTPPPTSPPPTSPPPSTKPSPTPSPTKPGVPPAPPPAPVTGTLPVTG
jgi:hypothetical protein